MFRLEKEFRFEASHKLPYHDGKCSRLHGHSWKGRLVCEGDVEPKSDPKDPKQGMLVDYGDLSKAIDPIVETYLDHWHLNDSLSMISPTSEMIAAWVFHQLKPTVPLLKAVIIEETCTSRVEYRP